jgi:hypothetical protein
MMAIKLLGLSLESTSVAFPSAEIFFYDVSVSDRLCFVLALSASGFVFLSSVPSFSIGIELIYG